MEQTKKFQLTGLIVWGLIVMSIIPGWYENPVNLEAHLQSEQKKALAYSVVPEPIYALKETTQDTRNDILKSAQETHAAEQLEKERLELPSKLQKIESPQTQKSQIDDAQVAAGKWIIRLASFFEKRKAAEQVVLAKQHGFDLEIKEFSGGKIFSLRSRVYEDKQQAMKDQAALVKLLKLHDSNLLKID